MIEFRRCVVGVALIGCGAEASNGPGLPPGPDSEKTLAGTWEATLTGDPDASARIELSATRLVVTVDEYVLTYRVQGARATASWEAPPQGAAAVERTDISVSHSPSAFDAGMLPLELGGVWDFEAGEESCDATVSGGGFTAGCKGRPYASLKIPNGPSIAGSVTGQRVQELDSSFGDLGGRWELTTDRGEKCTATFSGETFSADCSEAREIAAGVTVIFAGDIASGTTTRGAEFSAVRL